VIAHVRRASKGIPKLVNSHPFVFGQWVFAHNGTLTALDAIRDGMLREIPARLKSQIEGETDSELMFYWLLRRLEVDKAIEGNNCLSLSRMRETIATEILELDRRNLVAEAKNQRDEQARLNVFLSNGSVFLGTRLRNTMFYLEQRADRTGDRPFRSFSLASEPPDSRPWQEVPDRSVFSISSSLKWTLQPLD
jgi:predicted glutamine amidotransferase